MVDSTILIVQCLWVIILSISVHNVVLSAIRRRRNVVAATAVVAVAALLIEAARFIIPAPLVTGEVSRGEVS